MIAYATARIPNVSFLTNAFYLADDILDCVVESRLSYVAVSFDGVEEVYEKIRHPARFEESRGRLRNLLARREAAGSVLPQVRLCTIWPAIRHDPDRYRTLMEPVSDYMVYNPYINFRGPMTLKEGFVCQYPWQRIMVAWNGDVQCCTGWNASDIVLGNAAEGSIKEYWSSPALERIRSLHAQGRRMELRSCAECRHGCAGDPNIDLDAILSREA
jgi:radical SAM protein with 4Fe4S-binding SPASM domain